MNRFAAFTVLVVAAFALAANSSPTPNYDGDVQSEFALVTDDQEEVADVVKNNMAVYAPFCTQSRDFVFTDLKQKTNRKASQAFTQFFDASKDVVSKSVAVQEDTAQRLARQLAEPSTEVEGDDEVSNYQRMVAESPQPMGLFQAVRGTAYTVTSAFVSAATEKIKELKEKIGEKQAYVEMARNACGLAATYKESMEEQLEQYKQENLRDDAKEQYGLYSLADIPCTTSQRIQSLSTFCQIVEQSFDNVVKLFKRPPVHPGQE